MKKSDLKRMNDLIKMQQGTLKVRKKRKPPVRKSPKNEMREKQIEREIIEGLRLRGYVCSKSGEQSTYNSNLIMDGIADIFVLTTNGVVFLEVKAPGNKQTGKQQEFEMLCRERGILYCVVHSVVEALGLICS